MKTRNLINKLAKYFPKGIALKYHDYPGLQVGKLRENTDNILICLDFDEIVLKYMFDNNLLNEIDLIITHHPFIFGKKNDVLSKDKNKAKITDEIFKYNIPIYSYHTNFDEGKNGMNDALAQRLNLKNIHSLSKVPMARGGCLIEPMNVNDFALYAKNKLNVQYGLLLPYGKEIINNVAIIGGGGWYEFKEAQNEGYDIFISGDIPHHGRRDVISCHYNYLDLPHEIENIFMEQMKKVILEIDNTLNIITVEHEKCPKVI